MELYDIMRTTFAARQFTDDPLPDDVLWRILDNARFAPSGGNRQGAHIIVIRDAEIKQRLSELGEPTVRRYVAQRNAGENPWNPVVPTAVAPDIIDETAVPASFVEPIRRAPVVLVVSVDLGRVAAVDQFLDRVGVVSGASVYPLVWNILLGARAEGYGGNLTSMAIAQEPAVRDLLGLPADHAVAAVVPIGKPVKQLTKLRRQAVDEFVTIDQYDGPAFRG
ncbi:MULTISPECIES: nitroreductase family protein [Gordonia]|uniref:Nitroreductase family protein n=1 Tax=Gordonia tangerina TaxID=2911060 RepID=A0ABS9DSF5_9ACTN|nr:MULTISPECIES: nitroreductase family protein [Gordonia]MAU81212.1 nitroreductase [Gordonia sp. (in: high G+C Gram-positive bacteria)]MCF3940758.1 nitroreductase family protein [Gordonia tangerina]